MKSVLRVFCLSLFVGGAFQAHAMSCEDPLFEKYDLCVESCLDEVFLDENTTDAQLDAHAITCDNRCDPNGELPDTCETETTPRP